MASSPVNSLIVIAVVAVIIELAAATNHTVGKPGGSWDLSTSLSSWASSITFKSGDNLIFSYSPTSHDVAEVNKANYASCTAAGAIKTYSSGNDVIPLRSAGKRYFICGVPGHCTSGMKLEVDVIAAAKAPSSSSGAAQPPLSRRAGSPQPSPSSPSSGSPPPFGSHPLIPATPAPESPQAVGSTPTSTPAPSAAGRRSSGAAGVITGLGMLIIICGI
ncbi:hypothetical protein KSP40_PGU016953 [Platanthera guangdongensis]|uniref:Phytocyanin domain-containing protein n=1 Tax=Platanthera guangdongensis TaxID=2320717 RepID=A0ABR2MYY0_9ASPA